MKPISMSPYPHAFPSHGHGGGSLFLSATHVCSQVHLGEFPGSMDASDYGADLAPMGFKKSASNKNSPRAPALRESDSMDAQPAAEVGPTCFDRLASAAGWNSLDAALSASLEPRLEDGMGGRREPPAYKIPSACPQTYLALPRGAATSASSSQIALMSDGVLDAAPDGNVEGMLERSGSNQREESRSNGAESATAPLGSRAKSLSRSQRQGGGVCRTLLPLVSVKSKGEEGSLFLAGDILPAPAHEVLLRTSSRSPRSLAHANLFKIKSEDMAASPGSGRGGDSDFGCTSSTMPPTFQPATQVDASRSMSNDASEPVQRTSSPGSALPPLSTSRSYDDWLARKPAGAARLALSSHSAADTDPSGAHGLATTTSSPSGGQKKRNRIPSEDGKPQAPGLGPSSPAQDLSPVLLSRSITLCVPPSKSQPMDVSTEHSAAASLSARLARSSLRKTASGSISLLPGSPEAYPTLDRALSFKEGLAPLQLDAGTPPKSTGSPFGSLRAGVASSRLGSAATFSDSPLGKSTLSETSRGTKSGLSKAPLPPLNLDLSLDSLKRSLDTDMSSPTSCNGDGISSASRGGAHSPSCLSPQGPPSPASVESSPSPVLHRRLTGNRFTIMEDCWQAAPQRKMDEGCHGLRSVHEIEEMEGPDAFFKGFGEDAPMHPTSKKTRPSFS